MTREVTLSRCLREVWFEAGEQGDMGWPPINRKMEGPP